MSPPRTLFVLAGQRFGRGVVTDPEVSLSKRGQRIRGVRLLCDCGNSYEARLSALLRGNNPSCGCLSRNRRTWHGLYDHPLYATWWNMIQRCENPEAIGYARYGGRGISVCMAWHDLAVFVTDVERLLGPRPDGMTLDRWPDIDGNYELGNIRWASWSEQRCNQVRGTLTESQVREIRSRHEAGVTNAALAKEFRCSASNIWRIVTGVNWRHVL